MDRITRSHLDSALAIFCKRAGFRLATAYNDVGGYRLDHAACYGGWCVEVITNKGGAVSRPFGHTRHSAREMYDMLHFAAQALYESRYVVNYTASHASVRSGAA